MGVRGDSVERQQRQTEVRAGRMARQGRQGLQVGGGRVARQGRQGLEVGGGRMARQGRQNSIADFPAGFIEGTQSYTTSHTGRDNIPHRRYTIDNHTVYR